jgi:hypothetical protein
LSEDDICRLTYIGDSVASWRLDGEQPGFVFPPFGSNFKVTLAGSLMTSPGSFVNTEDR